MSQFTVPEEWIETTLGEIIELKYGKSLPADKRDGEGFPVYGSNGVVGKHLEPLVPHAGIVVGRKGSYGEVHFSKNPFFPIDTTYFVDCFFEQPLRYWFYQLKLLPLTSLNRSTAIPGLNREDAYEQIIFLPPLAEQQQIAQKLDELLAQVDTLKARLDAIPNILKRFRQLVLAAAVSGRLTEEGRGSVDLPALKDKLKSEWVEYQLQLSSSKGKKLSSEALVRKYREPEFLTAPDEKLEKWITLSLKDLILEKNQGVNTTTEKVVYSSSGIPAIQAGNIGNRHIEYNSEKFISEEKFNELSDSVKPTLSDVLYTNIGANFGNAAVVKKNDIQFVITWNVLKIRPSKELNSEYLAIVLNTEKIRAEAWSSVSTSTVPFVNGKKVDEFQIPLPPLEEQTEIVRRVEQLFAYADQIEQRVKDAQARVNHLTQSILAKAFRGELTADWRAQNPELISGENSAAVLLERIKAERETTAKPKRKVKA